MPQFEQVSVFSSLIFWSLISFVILLFLLKRYAFPPILEALEARQKKIESDIQSAEDLRAEAQKLKQEFEDQLKTAHDKAKTIIQLATEEARKIQEKTLSETQAKCRQLQKDAEHEIHMSRNKIMKEIQGYVSALTVAATEKILARSLSDDDRKRLVNESIQEVVQNIEAKV